MKGLLVISAVFITACATQVPLVADTVDGQRQDWLAVSHVYPVPIGCEVIKVAEPVQVPGEREKAFKRSFYK